MLRVGVDAWNLPYDRRGVGRYVRAILDEWNRAFAAHVSVTLIVPEWHTWTVRSRYLRELDRGRYRVVSRALHARAALDVLWFPFNGCSWDRFALPAVATLHDASPFVLPDLVDDVRPVVYRAAARCGTILTDSIFSQHELARALGLPLERIVPVPLGVAAPLPPARAAVDAEALRPYVLFVGTSDARKGLDVLYRAMARVQRDDPALQLVVAGERSDAIAALAGVRAELLGRVDDATLAALYRNAEIFAFPSRYEGFGLPVLEAMSYGTPVVTTNGSALPEAGGDAALYVEADDDEALAAAIARVRSDTALAAALRERGRAHAASMTWTKTAERTLEVLEHAAAKPIFHDG